MAFDVHEVADGNYDLLDLLSEFSGWGEDQRLAGLKVGVDLLQSRDGESGSLACARLCLRNYIRS